MFPQINLSPLSELLSNAASPHELANLLDELAFDYARTVIALQQQPLLNKTGMHGRTTEFIWCLYTLRDTLRACQP